MALEESAFLTSDYRVGGGVMMGGLGRGDHFLFYKFIERTTER